MGNFTTNLGALTSSAPLHWRALSPAQAAVLPLQPVFAACKRRGLDTSESSRERRLLAINLYCKLIPFTFIESFKEMLSAENIGMVDVVVDAIDMGVLAW
jgi:hypothetical protein